MAENSKIDATFNPWRGCTKVSAGCANCYAETMSGRNPGTLGKWGPNGTRVVASESMWREPLKWDRDAKAAGERRRVFCASLADVFEDWQGPMVDSNGFECTICDTCHGAYLSMDGRTCHICGRPARLVTMSDVRARLFALIDATQNLDWLLLTKRPENIARMMPDAGFTLDQKLFMMKSAVIWNPAIEEAMREKESDNVRPKLWLGVSVEDQQRADERIPLLLQTPAAVRFLSCEPLLGSLDISRYLFGRDQATGGCVVCGHPVRCRCEPGFPSIDWIIVGGESGHGARPCNLAWIRSIVQQCKAAGVACFVKQLGAHPYENRTYPFPAGINGNGVAAEGIAWRLRDKKGGDPDEWPDDIRVREFPRVEAIA